RHRTPRLRAARRPTLPDPSAGEGAWPRARRGRGERERKPTRPPACVRAAPAQPRARTRDARPRHGLCVTAAENARARPPVWPAPIAAAAASPPRGWERNRRPRRHLPAPPPPTIILPHGARAPPASPPSPVPRERARSAREGSSRRCRPPPPPIPSMELAPPR
ncbi:atherin-like, partial [Numida meleagris]|uniref:atherin-like n=1 Tax=Numida meleagris TaxID=8996 RepID=UPI000B3E2555